MKLEPCYGCRVTEQEIARVNKELFKKDVSIQLKWEECKPLYNSRTRHVTCQYCGFEVKNQISWNYKARQSKRFSYGQDAEE